MLMTRRLGSRSRPLLRLDRSSGTGALARLSPLCSVDLNLVESRKCDGFTRTLLAPSLPRHCFSTASHHNHNNHVSSGTRDNNNDVKGDDTQSIFWYTWISPS